MAELFVGMTTWDDAFFLPVTLQSLKNCFDGVVDYTVCIVDNESRDDSCRIAKEFGCRVIVKNSSQSDALNMLLDLSTGDYTLLLHSDVALLSKDLWGLLSRSSDERNILISPEDIGMGELWRRDYGVGMPESSFMFWKTKQVRKLRSFRSFKKWSWYSFFRHPLTYIPTRRFDFYGPHLTHRIPALLERNGMCWTMMDVHASPKAEVPWYTNHDADALWDDAWARLEYGFGNFYSLNGALSHYHNWLTRYLSPANANLRLNREGVPVAFIKEYTERFINHYRDNKLRCPDVRMQ
jgi:glycosyltransferase involved in cell wall biosynthesis